MPSEIDAQDDNEDPDEFSLARPQIPATVRNAGIVWILFGGLILLATLVSLGMAASQAGQQPEAIVGMCGSTMLSAFFGFAFIFVGQQSLRGKARDTLGGAVGSIAIGLFLVVVGIIAIGRALELSRRNPGATVLPSLIVGAIELVSGLGLMVAGILALVGRTEYKEWRNWEKKRMTETQQPDIEDQQS